MPEKAKLRLLDTAAVILAATFLWMPLLRADFRNDAGRSLLKGAAFNDAGGAMKLPNSGCYQRETVGECAARIVQNKVSSFYLILIALSAAQAGVGYFTWRVLLKQAEITDRQVDAQKGRPLLYPIIERWPRAELERAQKMSPDFQDHLELSSIGIDISLKNYGSVPAVLISVALKLVMSDIGPPTGQPLFHPHKMPKIRVLKPDLQTPDVRYLLLHPFTKVDYDRLMADTFYLWFYGRIVCEDMWGIRYITDVCWRYSLGTDVAEPHPLERNRTYRSKWQPPEAGLRECLNNDVIT